VLKTSGSSSCEELVDLAVAVVLGAAFAAVVAAFVANIITPLIAAIFGKPSFSGLTFTINKSTFHYGLFINALITFLLVSVVLFFFVIRRSPPSCTAPAHARGGASPQALPRVHDRDPRSRPALPQCTAVLISEPAA